ncbi:MAG: hypothetical protein U0325_30205 [Polyangiales bacterium]
MGNFGEEMVTVNNPETQEIPDDVSVTQRLIDVAQIPAPKFLFFHPRVDLFGEPGSETLPPYDFPDGRVGRVLVFPERHTLWFARGDDSACAEHGDLPPRLDSGRTHDALRPARGAKPSVGPRGAPGVRVGSH